MTCRGVPNAVPDDIESCHEHKFAKLHATNSWTVSDGPVASRFTGSPILVKGGPEVQRLGCSNLSPGRL